MRVVGLCDNCPALLTFLHSLAAITVVSRSGKRRLPKLPSSPSSQADGLSSKTLTYIRLCIAKGTYKLGMAQIQAGWLQPKRESKCPPTLFR